MEQPEREERGMHAARAVSHGAEDAEHRTSAQLLRRHALDLIESAERLLAQAEAELEAAYAILGGSPAFHSR